MEKRLLDLDYRFRPPRPSAFWQWALTPVRRWLVRRKFRVEQIDLRGREHVEGLGLSRPLEARAEARGGVMFAINHPAHGDPFVVFEAMHRLRVPCCYLAAWQVFTGGFGLKAGPFSAWGRSALTARGPTCAPFARPWTCCATGPGRW